MPQRDVEIKKFYVDFQLGMGSEQLGLKARYINNINEI